MLSHAAGSIVTPQHPTVTSFVFISTESYGGVVVITLAPHDDSTFPRNQAQQQQHDNDTTCADGLLHARAFRSEASRPQRSLLMNEDEVSSGNDRSSGY